ncbi:MAG: pyrroline-5-carboxylate reductase [Phycisphaerales bacterium]
MTAELGVLGAGAMGSAIVRGAIDAGLVRPIRIVVVEPDDDRRDAMRALGCCVTGVPQLAIDADVLLLAIKPQKFAGVVAAIGHLQQPTLVLTVMAGLSSAVIRQAMGVHARVVRMMPNTPCRIRKGMTAIAKGEGARAADVDFAHRLMRELGEVVHIDESHMHAVTAVSGSGPAYVFLLAEAMEQAGVQIGLDGRTARLLAYQTVFGAGALLVDDPETTADSLRNAVTSPGGTTAAALEVMFEKELPQIIAEAISSARDRGMELGAAR